MTFTVNTLYQAIYMVDRDSCFITTNVLGTTGGTANVGITETLPILAKYPEATYIVPFAAIVQDWPFLQVVPIFHKHLYLFSISPNMIFLTSAWVLQGL